MSLSSTSVSWTPPGLVIAHLPGQPIPAPDHSLREEAIPNVQPESSQVQLKAIL